jgi:hypothetical protein
MPNLSIASRGRKSRPKANAAVVITPDSGQHSASAVQTVAASELQATAFAPLRYALPGLLPEGVTLLVSRPKLGKSWLMLDIAIAIATGRAVLGTIEPETGDVLYLALDDGERRLQGRMAALLQGKKAWPARLALATRWRRARRWSRGHRRVVPVRCKACRHCHRLTRSLSKPAGRRERSGL